MKALLKSAVLAMPLLFLLQLPAYANDLTPMDSAPPNSLGLVYAMIAFFVLAQLIGPIGYVALAIRDALRNRNGGNIRLTEIEMPTRASDLRDRERKDREGRAA
jgi:type III secretory pathway component EscU